MDKKKAKNDEKPIIVIKSKFNLLVFLFANPIRVLGGLAVLLIMLPEFNSLITYLTNLGDPFTTIISVIIVMGLCVAAPLIVTFIEYKSFPYYFYKDRLSFTMGALMREKTTIPYKSIRRIDKKQSAIQKQYNMSHLSLAIRAGRLQTHDDGFELPDIPNPIKIHKQLNNILKAYHTANPAITSKGLSNRPTNIPPVLDETDAEGNINNGSLMQPPVTLQTITPMETPSDDVKTIERQAKELQSQSKLIQAQEQEIYKLNKLITQQKNVLSAVQHAVPIIEKEKTPDIPVATVATATPPNIVTPVQDSRFSQAPTSAPIQNDEQAE